MRRVSSGGCRSPARGTGASAAVRGREGVQALVARYPVAFPNVRFTVEDQVVDGRIVREREVVDMVGLFTQLGIAPMPPR